MASIKLNPQTIYDFINSSPTLPQAENFFCQTVCDYIGDSIDTDETINGEQEYEQAINALESWIKSKRNEEN